jgi:TonB family protein
MRSAQLLLPLFLLAAQGRFGRVQDSLSHGRLAEATKELQRIAVEAGPRLERPSPAEEKVLRRAIETSRKILVASRGAEDRNAARQVLCLSRAYFSEELPGIEEALRVGGGVRRPELIGEPIRRFPPEARKAGVQGTVIVEAIIDREGCTRRPKVLKGVSKGVDGAALAAVRSWSFQPATLNGRPVAVHYVVLVTFSLEDSR